MSDEAIDIAVMVALQMYGTFRRDDPDQEETPDV